MMFTADSSGEAPDPQCNCAGEVLVGTERSDYDFDTYTAPVVASAGSLPIASGGSGSGSITAPITSGNGTKTSPYVMTGTYDTMFRASDTALAANAQVDDWVTTQIAGRINTIWYPSYSKTFQILAPAIQFLSPVTGGLGTVANPWILGGGPYTEYRYANEAAFPNFRWGMNPGGGNWYPWTPARQSWASWNGLDFPVVRAQLYNAAGGVVTKTFTAWDVRYIQMGPFFPGGGSGTVGDPYLCQTTWGSGLIDFDVLAAAQYYIQRQEIGIVDKYWSVKIATVATDIQVP